MNSEMRVSDKNATLEVAVGAEAVEVPVSLVSPRTIPMTVADDSERLAFDAGSDPVTIPVKCTINVHPSEYPDYRGPFEFTPTTEAQVIPVHDQVPHQDIVIDPIPSNYGLITWNGSVITVS